jgi:raffinose/stachyose/melibiose transport system substrate-binding protein
MLILCLSLVFVLAGCGGGSNNGSSSSQNASAGSGSGGSNNGGDKKVEISIMTRWGDSDPLSPFLNEVIAKFEELHPNVKVINDSISEEASYNNKLKTAIATGDTPSIFYWPGVAGITDWAKNGVLMDVTPLTEDKEWFDGFISGSFEIWNLEKYGVQGRFGIPIGFNPEVMFYNPKLFEQAGIAKVPETMDELYDAIDKLNASGVIPWGVGAKDTWRVGHIHNNIYYRLIGVDAAKDLGTRSKKWTDADVVQSLALVKELKDRGAFQQGFEGIDYNTERSDFLGGKSAMMLNGAWAISEIMASDSPYKDDFRFFPFPYYTDKPELKSDSVLYNEVLFLSGTMEGAEKEAAIEFAKFLTGKEMQELKLQKYERLPSRTDVQASESASQILKDMVAYMGTIQNPGGDVHDYDPNPAVIDVIRNSLIGILLGNTPEQAAQEIQKSNDSYDNSRG